MVEIVGAWAELNLLRVEEGREREREREGRKGEGRRKERERGG